MHVSETYAIAHRGDFRLRILFTFSFDFIEVGEVRPDPPTDIDGDLGHPAVHNPHRREHPVRLHFICKPEIEIAIPYAVLFSPAIRPSPLFLWINERKFQKPEHRHRQHELYDR
jgi:hypothetical protein